MNMREFQESLNQETNLEKSLKAFAKGCLGIALLCMLGPPLLLLAFIAVRGLLKILF